MSVVADTVTPVTSTHRPTAASHEHGKNRKADDRRIRRGKNGRRAALRDARENG